MKYDGKNQHENDIATAQLNWLIINQKKYELSELKETRTLTQNNARWRYLTMIATILNERGETFTPPLLKLEVFYTKDNLYETVWQPLRHHLYPNKPKQLNTKEFCRLVNLVQMAFAKTFQISIPFPNLQDFLHKKEIENKSKNYGSIKKD